MIIRWIFLTCLAVCAQSAQAADADPVLDIAERFARQQTQGLPGKVTVTAVKLDTSRLPPCTTLEGYAPPGTRLSGRTHVGVRCLAPNTWSILVPVQIAISGNYVSTARPVVAGQTILASDLVTATGDLSALPTGVVTDPANAIGKTVRNSLGAGQPLRNDQLQAPLVVRQGQKVRVVSTGLGFAVSAEGNAINNAALGQVVQVKMSTGQTLSGIAKADGSIEISF
jgi:flagellar basal body P-ring formation protein FlgA